MGKEPVLSSSSSGVSLDFKGSLTPDHTDGAGNFFLPLPRVTRVCQSYKEVLSIWLLSMHTGKPGRQHCLCKTVEFMTWIPILNREKFIIMSNIKTFVEATGGTISLTIFLIIFGIMNSHWGAN